MTTKAFNLILAAAMALTFCSAVQAQAEEAKAKTPAEKFAQSDTDGDGCVSWEELRNQGSILFAHLDTNSDGVISGDEHVKAVNAKGEAVQPNSVDAESFQVALKESFDRADTDSNGCLSMAEFAGG